MIDIKRIREDAEGVKAGLLAKECDCSAEIDRILELDVLRRDAIFKVEQLKNEQNKVSKQIPAMKKAGEDVAPIFAQMKELSDYFPADCVENYQKVGGTPHLDYHHTVFGQVYQGMDVVDAIAAVDTDGRDKPLTDVVILSAEVSVYG